MTGVFQLNTAQHGGLSQALLAYHGGLIYDHNAAVAAGSGASAHIVVTGDTGSTLTAECAVITGATHMIPVVPGDIITAGATVNVIQLPSVAIGCRLKVYFYDAGINFLAPFLVMAQKSFVTGVAGVGNGTVIAPSNAAYCRLAVGSTVDAGQVFEAYIDNVWATKNASALNVQVNSDFEVDLSHWQGTVSGGATVTTFARSTTWYASGSGMATVTDPILQAHLRTWTKGGIPLFVEF